MKPTILLALLGLFAGCGPRILVPTGTPAHMERPYETQEIDHVIVYVENLLMRGDHLLFDIEIENNSKQCLRYHSQSMYFQTYDNKGYQKPNNSVVYRSGDYSPGPLQWQTPAYSERQAQEFLKHKIKSQKTGKTFLDLLAVGLLINEAVQESKDNSKPYWTERDTQRAENRAIVNFAAQAALAAGSNIMAKSIISSSWEHEDLEHGYLSFGELDPGEGARGLVVFPKKINAEVYEVFIPLGERLFEFVFEKSQ